MKFKPEKPLAAARGSENVLTFRNKPSRDRGSGSFFFRHIYKPYFL
jgi:hypothetical protein